MRLLRVQLPALGAALVLACSGVSQAALIQHLDASDAGSVVLSAGEVTQWNDQTANANNATADTGTVAYPSSPGFPSGLDGVRFDGTSGKSRLLLMDPAQQDSFLDQSGVSPAGFAVFIVARPFSNATTDWQDLIGNTSLVGNSDGFAIRWNGGNGSIQTYLGGSNNQINDLPFNTPGAVNIIGVNYDPSQVGAELLLAADGYSSSFGSVSASQQVAKAPADFSPASRNFTLGAFVNGSGARRFDGAIGEVLIYDAALNASEFQAELDRLNVKWTPEPASALLALIGACGALFCRSRN